jgi:hypothetical protein
LMAAASSGADPRDKTKHETPQMLIRSATEAPFISLEACSIRLLIAGNETIPLLNQSNESVRPIFQACSQMQHRKNSPCVLNQISRRG